MPTEQQRILNLCDLYAVHCIPNADGSVDIYAGTWVQVATAREARSYIGC